MHDLRRVPKPALVAIALIALPAILLAALRVVPALDATWLNNPFHFWVVSVASLAAGGICLLLLLSARSIRETRVLFLALCFLTLALIFAVHGLSTPGHLFHHVTGALQRSPWLSTLAGGSFACLAAIALPGQTTARPRLPLLLFAAVVGAAALYVGVSLAAPDWAKDFPTQQRWFQVLLTVVVVWLFGVAAWHFFQSYLFTRLPAQAAIAVSMAFLAEAQLSLLFGRTWQLSWWLYHGLFLAGFLIVLAAWGWEWRRARSVSAIADAVVMRDALAQLGRGRPALAVSLAEEIERHDAETYGHVHRVGVYAYEMGRKLELGPAALRDLVLGAQLHDLGKIYIPRRVLQKPGKLTDAEFDLIKTHPRRGAELLQQVPGMQHVAQLVCMHHERLDARGYPDALPEPAIPLEARIISVADAFDVMTRGRVYQAPRSVEDALAELRNCEGTQFDRRCIDALVTAIEDGSVIPAQAMPQVLLDQTAADAPSGASERAA